MEQNTRNNVFRYDGQKDTREYILLINTSRHQPVGRNIISNISTPVSLSWSCRNRAMTESPRRPPVSDLSRTGYRSYTSPADRLSKRLGASLPNLDQPVCDSTTALSLKRPASLRKVTPDIGQYPQKQTAGERSLKAC